jgi:RimJ/RimL family protein N-acetyltransferase
VSYGSTVKVLDLELRPSTADDASFSADLYTAVHPDDPQDPRLLAHSWSVDAIANVIERSVITQDGRPVGIATRRHAPWENMPKRYGRVSAELMPALRTRERLDALHALMEERQRADGTRIFVAWAWENDSEMLGVLTARRYREERRERFWECDLVANRDRLTAMAAQSRERMRDEGITILTVDRDADPERYRKIWRMTDEAEQDIPTTVPHVPTSWETFGQWMRSPGLHEDRTWIARLDDDIVGISMLSYPPVRGVVMTDWTGTARSVRGRGVARALKCETVMQAIALGVDRVRTDNDGENAPILHLNETMGYRRRADMIQHLKPA